MSHAAHKSWPALLWLCVCLSAAPVLAEQIEEDPLQRRMLEIAKELRCAVCQNQPVSESNSELAQDMRAIIMEKIEAGESNEAIIDYFVQRYGDYVLLKPSYQGWGAALWLMPGLVFIIALVFAWTYLRSRRRQDLPSVAPLSEDDRLRIQAELAALQEQDSSDR